MIRVIFNLLVFWDGKFDREVKSYMYDFSDWFGLADAINFFVVANHPLGFHVQGELHRTRKFQEISNFTPCNVIRAPQIMIIKSVEFLEGANDGPFNPYFYVQLFEANEKVASVSFSERFEDLRGLSEMLIAAAAGNSPLRRIPSVENIWRGFKEQDLWFDRSGGKTKIITGVR